MREQGAEHFIETQRFGAVAEFGGQGLALPIQLEEHLGLIFENVRLDGFVDEIHGAGFISLELAVQLARPRGDENQRVCAGCARCRAKAPRVRSRPCRASVHRGTRAPLREPAAAPMLQSPSARLEFPGRSRASSADSASKFSSRSSTSKHLIGSERRDIHGQFARGATVTASKVRNRSAISAGGITASAGRNCSADNAMFGARAVCGDCTTVTPPAS